jgi:IS1 family transposase
MLKPPNPRLADPILQLKLSILNRGGAPLTLAVTFPSLRLEGAILSPELFARVEDLPGQRPADFGLPAGGVVKDEIARAWADAQDYWRIFQRKLDALHPNASATTETRNLWIVPLLGLLGYQLERHDRGLDLHGKLYPISHHAANRAGVPVHIVSVREPAGLDRRPERTSGPRMSAHGLVQEYLNLADQTYGLVTNGRLLRLLRDSSRLVKLTYLEFDLDRIFTDGLYADFALLYRFLHASRLPASSEATAESLIERYHLDSVEAGARIRDGLSKAVETAIKSFANGLLAHPRNDALRAAVQSGQLTPSAYYSHLLRLIYRLLFLLVIEERNLVYPLSPSATKRDLYYRFYSLQRVRRLADTRHLDDPRKDDAWLAVLACFQLFEAGGPGSRLGIAPLAGDLFRSDAIGLIRDCHLDNATTFLCLRALSLYENEDAHTTIRVNYAALNVEEFGSVYQGLLEFEPVFHTDGPRPAFAFRQGDERAATGSHYTPDDLVQPLLKHALDPLIVRKLKEPDPAAALLSLRVADISCGSGHILLAAARRIGTELAIVRTGEEQPSPAAFRAAVRDVVRHCIYGVDLNPLAVELCKVALWLEAHNPGEPLNFLDHHIKCGNAIVGFVRREELERGVPDEAFVTLPGDDKDIAAHFRRRNRDERAGKSQTTLHLAPELQAQLDQILARWREISSLPEKDPAEIEAKKHRYEQFASGPDAWHLAQLAAIPIAQFYTPKTEATKAHLLTDEAFRDYLAGKAAPRADALGAARALAERKRFFHWFLQFPEIIARGGFDCILGNPPYLGGQALSGTYGHAFCNYVKWEFAPTGLSDLVVYFLRRIHSLLRPGGFTGFITTNSIKDGDVRKDGLEQVIAAGSSINFAVRGIKWPGIANLVVSLVSIHRGAWSGPRQLDGKAVDFISSYFENEKEGTSPDDLSANSDSMFVGTVFLGDGFLLDHATADSWRIEDPKNGEVLTKIINGQELNNSPTQSPGRSIINFSDWSMEKASVYEKPFHRVYSEVKPIREKGNRAARVERWWQYAERAAGLYKRTTGKVRCFAAARTTKHLNFSALPTDILVSDSIYVFTTDRWDLYAVVQSNIHEVWARKYSGALETRLRYSPSDCFETFAFPTGQWHTANPQLAAVGERYHEHRRALMLRLWLGLTDIYNLFHDRDLTPAEVARVSKKVAEAEAGYAGILQLRALHRELDEAVLAAYCWTGQVALGHDFHEVETLPENDRVRYTISPAARKELLRHLLALNHQRAAEEKSAQATAPKAAKKPRLGKVKPAPNELGLQIEGELPLG